MSGLAEDVYRQFLTGSLALCGLAAVFSLFRWKKFGPGALFMFGGFLVMGGLIWALLSAQPMPVVIGISVVLCVLLAGDMLMRGNPKP